MPGTAPTFTTSASLSIDEGNLIVDTIHADDLDLDTVTYSIVGGADELLFTIDANTGVLSFINAPDFENPISAIGGDNIYDVRIRASDGTLNTNMNFTVTVNDVTPVTLTGDEFDNVIGPTGETVDGDTLLGLGGDDTLTANLGNDILDGGEGADTMAGGVGDDTYYVDNVGDVVNEIVGEGFDTVNSSVTFAMGATDGINVLNLTGTAAINGTGNNLANTITGNAKNNVIDGGAGADTMAGGAGNDTYYVDNVGDTITEAVNSGTDSVFSSVNYTLAAYVDNLTLTGTAFEGHGNELANVITGNDEANDLYGEAGNDTLNGGIGFDFLIGGAGNDTYIVNDDLDRVFEVDGEGQDIVKAGISFSLTDDVDSVDGFVEDLTLTGSDNLQGDGNSLDNAITGNSGDNLLKGFSGNDRLAGGAGADDMRGGNGDDLYYVDNVLDEVKELAGQGKDKVISTKTYTLGDNVENLTLSLSAAVDGTGNELNNTLIGNTAANTLMGLDGNDKIDGGGGADTMIGGLGNDKYWVGSAADVVTELDGEGTDTVNSSINYTLGDFVENLSLKGLSTISGTGNDLDNTIKGNLVANTLNGMGGNDVLKGGAGADTLNGGDGDDVYYYGTGDTVNEAVGEGTDTVISSKAIALLMDNVENLTFTGGIAVNGTGNDLDNVIEGNKANNTLDGGLGDDTINGNNGNDKIYGGEGADIMSGGAGTDKFYFTSINDSGTNVGVDTDLITDYRNGETIDLSGIDAIAGGGDDAFVIDVDSIFTEGEMSIVQVGTTATVSLYDDNSGNAAMVFQIELGASVTQVDFIL